MALLLPMCCLPLAVAAQPATAIPLASEPHHHLALHNEYVNVYEVEVAPHDSVLLHRHDVDAISLMTSDAQVTVHTPGKPDMRHKLVDGQIRLQSRGYVHSTSIDGDTTYRNVTIELLLHQQGARNLCAAVIPDQPLNCPGVQALQSNETHVDQPQFETEQTYVTLIHLLPHQILTAGDLGGSELIVALDAVAVANRDGKGPESVLHPGDFVWLDQGRAAQVFKNNGDKETRLISFKLRSQGFAEPASTSAK
jgi:hypothetical protein